MSGRRIANASLPPDAAMGDNHNMPNSSDALRVGVAGAGAFGRNHARVYRDLQADPSQNIQFLGIADVDYARAQAVAREFGTQAFRSLDETDLGWRRRQRRSRCQRSRISKSPLS